MLGLKVLIKNGFVHRDIKPENILMHGGNFKVGDFGLSTKCDIENSQLMKDTVGTPLYMSP
jgi:serine/threonine protein kinase